MSCILVATPAHQTGWGCAAPRYLACHDILVFTPLGGNACARSRNQKWLYTEVRKLRDLPGGAYPFGAFGGLRFLCGQAFFYAPVDDVFQRD